MQDETRPDKTDHGDKAETRQDHRHVNTKTIRPQDEGKSKGKDKGRPRRQKTKTKTKTKTQGKARQKTKTNTNPRKANYKDTPRQDNQMAQQANHKAIQRFRQGKEVPRYEEK
jgi:hypothetical protein